MWTNSKSATWTKSKSATLSLIFTRILIGLVIVFAAVLPLFFSIVGYGSRPDAGLFYIGMEDSEVIALFICAYASFVPAMIALLSLDRLLRIVRKGLVFTRESVKYLRTISWCCFAVAIIMLCGWPFISYVLIFVAAAAAFFGLLMRVVKNVIDAACEIKDENDFTI